jgi:hypothetical protein
MQAADSNQRREGNVLHHHCFSVQDHKDGPPSRILETAARCQNDAEPIYIFGLGTSESHGLIGLVAAT